MAAPAGLLAPAKERPWDQIHPKARTTPAVRALIASSAEPAGVLAKRHGVSAEINRTWRKRGAEDVQNHSFPSPSLTC